MKRKPKGIKLYKYSQIKSCFFGTNVIFVKMNLKKFRYTKSN